MACTTKKKVCGGETKTLKETTLQSFFFVANAQGLKANVHYKFNAQSNQILFPNKSIIFLKDLFLYPSDPNFDELGSLEITDAFIDETAQITKKAWDITKSRIRYRLEENNLIPKILWTSNPSKNWNYTDYFLLNENGELPECRKFVQSLVTDNPYISKHYITIYKAFVCLFLEGFVNSQCSVYQYKDCLLQVTVQIFFALEVLLFHVIKNSKQKCCNV
jgi:hypothetical protein